MGMEEADRLMFSLRPGRLLGFLYPDLGGHHEYIVYVGSIVFFLALFSLLTKVKSRKEYYWFGAGFVALIYSLGSFTPVARILSRLPGFNLIRVPSRALLIVSICLIFIASHKIDRMLVKRNIYISRLGTYILFAFISFSILCGVGVYCLFPEAGVPFIYGSISFLIVSIWMKLWFVPKPEWLKVGNKRREYTNHEGRVISGNLWFIGLVVLVILDYGVVNSSLLTFKTKDQVLSLGSEVANYLTEQNGMFRVYSPSYSLPQSTAMSHNIELADGVDPLQLHKYVEYFEIASGVPVSGYSVTLPPFTSGNPGEDNRKYIPDLLALGRLNVAYVVSEFDIEVEGLSIVAEYGGSRIYENLYSLPRAWVRPKEERLDDGSTPIIPAKITTYRPNRIELSAQGPGKLIISEILYPGWKITVDDEDIQIDQTYDLLPAIQLEDGEHQIIYAYRPQSVVIGLILMMFGLLSTGFIILKIPKP
jgi:hypothetical protein